MSSRSLHHLLSPASRIVQNSLAVAILCIAVLASYGNSFQNGFVSDDHYIIEPEPQDRLASAVVAVFLTSDKLVDSQESPYYRPLARALFVLERQLFGPVPRGFHVVSICFHILSTVLLYAALMLGGCNLVCAFGAALLFGVHPINAEAVNFISARNNIMAACFALGSFIASVASERNKRMSSDFLSGFLFFLGLLCKESALMFIPFLIFFKLYKQQPWRVQRDLLRWDVRFILFHVLFLGAYILLRAFAISSGHWHLNDPHTIARMLVSLVPEYLFLVLVPSNLTFHHVIPDSFSWSSMLLVKWIVLLAALLFLLKRKSDAVYLGLAWILINSIPISTVLSIPSAPMAERYLYLPMLGFVLVVAAVAVHYLKKLGSSVPAVLLFGSIAFILGIITFNRNFTWQDDLSLTRNTLSANPSAPFAHFDFGYESFLRGDNVVSEREFKTALLLDPLFPQASWAYYYLGTISMQSQDRNRAEYYFEKATEVQPGNSIAQYSFASIIQPTNNEKAMNAYRQFLVETALPNYHLLVEVRNELQKQTGSPRKTSASVPVQPVDPTRVLVHQYPSGTRLYYAQSNTTRTADTLRITTQQRLSHEDQALYAMKLLRFPLQTAREADFSYHIKCGQRLLIMDSMEFFDENGNSLGKVKPIKEQPLMNGYGIPYEYALPGTTMRSLVDTICTNE